jgi:hypothetical protein
LKFSSLHRFGSGVDNNRRGVGFFGNDGGRQAQNRNPDEAGLPEWGEGNEDSYERTGSFIFVAHGQSNSIFRIPLPDSGLRVKGGHLKPQELCAAISQVNVSGYTAQGARIASVMP